MSASKPAQKRVRRPALSRRCVRWCHQRAYWRRCHLHLAYQGVRRYAKGTTAVRVGCTG